MFRHRVVFYTLLSCLIFPLMLSGQEKNPEKIIAEVQKKFNLVKDYQAKVQIIVDVEFLKVPENEATIFFRQPDKVQVKTEGFALIPKEGLNFSPAKMFSGSVTSLYQMEEKFEGHDCAVLKIIPLDANAPFVLSTVWIDRKEMIIRKVEATTKESGSYQLRLQYGNYASYALPSKMVLEFDLKNFTLPKGFNGEFNRKQSQDKEKKTKGTVTLKYTDYRVNKGIPDSVFDGK